MRAWSKRNIRLPREGTSSLALVYSRLTVLRLQAGPKTDTKKARVIRVIVVMADEPDRLRIKDQIDRSYCSKTLLIYKKSVKKHPLSPKRGEKLYLRGIIMGKRAREGDCWSSYIWKIIPY